ncbi:electron carrier/ protein disulfide oxidoreductase [Anaeramoeba flamelloides]|uniref:Electron carrier/ protein disulfide oxidoreductase n=1 Tax=Anaeramoeba flamelloides TaxID=1746091 RepID=A0ABQ8Y4T2_9EUKA|nr:electron carrier/ protein disulfide oxidoreductase [Anaeramoeba flamelloides]
MSNKENEKVKEFDLKTILHENVSKEMASVLIHPQKLSSFRDFLVSVVSVESLCFYEDVIIFMKMKEHDQTQNEEIKNKLVEESTRLVNKYVETNSQLEINIDSSVRESVLENYQNPTRNLFDPAFEHVLGLMNDSLFPRFLRSKHHSEMLKILKKQINEGFEEIPDKKYKEGEIIVRSIHDESVLNPREWKGIAREPNIVASSLLHDLLDLINIYISAKNVLDIDLCSGSITFRRFSLATSELRNVYISDMTKQEKLVFFLNIYHLLLLHITLLHGPPKMNKSYRRHFKYMIGGDSFTLNDIQYGILGNNRSKSNIKKSKTYFKMNDSRSDSTIPLEPRINFALSNLTNLSPPVKVFYSESLEKQLMQSSIEYFQSIKIQDNKIKKKTQIFLPKKFQKFSKNFGKNDKKILNQITKFFPKNKKKLLIESTKKYNKLELHYFTSSERIFSIKIYKNQIRPGYTGIFRKN